MPSKLTHFALLILMPLLSACGLYGPGYGGYGDGGYAPSVYGQGGYEGGGYARGQDGYVSTGQSYGQASSQSGAHGGQYGTQPANQYPGQPGMGAPFPASAQGSQMGGPMGGQDIGEDYRLGTGDKLRVIVYGEEGLSGEFQVDGSGAVSLPLIGQIRANGQSVRQFEASVEGALRGRYLRDPKVSAEVLNFRPYYILGEINTPGTYPYISGLTILNAVATAQGFTYRANQRTVFIRHAGETRERQYQLDSSTPVRPGDTIRIVQRIF